MVALNRAVAVGLRDGPRAGLDALDAAARRPGAGHLRLPQRRPRRLPAPAGPVGAEAAAAYEEALALTDNEVERAFLVERLTEVERS